MAFTSHGYHIDGTSHVNPPTDIKLEGCGGPGLCLVCTQEAGAARKQTPANLIKTSKEVAIRTKALETAALTFRSDKISGFSGEEDTKFLIARATEFANFIKGD